MNSQFGNHNCENSQSNSHSNQYGNHAYDREHDKYIREKIRQAPKELLEKAEKYDWSLETIASMV